MKRIPNSFPLLLATGFLSTPSQAAIIAVPPGNVTASSQLTLNFNRLDDYIVSRGLNGAGEHTNLVGPSPNATMWLSTGNGFQGIDPDPKVTFDLGATYLVDQIHVWNYNESPPLLVNRGVNAVSVNFGTSPALGSSVPGITNFAIASGAPTYTGEVFNSFTPFVARYIEFDIDSNYGDASTFYGLSEVQFSGTLVPEPASALLGGLGLLALLRRRR